MREALHGRWHMACSPGLLEPEEGNNFPIHFPFSVPPIRPVESLACTKPVTKRGRGVCGAVPSLNGNSLLEKVANSNRLRKSATMLHKVASYAGLQPCRIMTALSSGHHLDHQLPLVVAYILVWCGRSAMKELPECVTLSVLPGLLLRKTSRSKCRET